MKLNKYFMMAAMGLGLVACSDNLDDGQGANGNASQEGTTYVALKLDFNNASSRATGDQPVDEPGSTTPPNYIDEEAGSNEAYIHDVRIIVTNESGVIEYNGVATADDDYYMIKIQPGVKNFYAIVNGEELKLTAPTAWGADAKLDGVKASDLAKFGTTSEEDKGFAMTSVDAVNQRINDNVTEAEAKTKESGNLVNITVEHMVAKVTAQLDDNLVAADGFDQQNFSLQSLSAQIMNADNVKYTASADPPTTYAGTYWMAYDEDNVRKTPYYEYTPAASVPESVLASGDAQVLYNSDAIGTDEDEKNPMGRFYCLENTHVSTNYKQGNTTYLKLTATMIPNHVVKFGMSGDDITISDETKPEAPATFYTIRGGYTGEGAENVYCVLQSDLADAYETFVSDGALTDGSADADKAAAVIAVLKTKGYTMSKEYTDGKGVYRIPVNDIMENGQYTNIEPVFRNDWYDLTITGIELPGDPADEDGDGGFDPEQPFHQTTNVAIMIAVQKWNKVTYDNVVLQ